MKLLKILEKIQPEKNQTIVIEIKVGEEVKNKKGKDR